MKILRQPGHRAAGLLLHPTSLPGPWGVGDLGTAAVRLLDWMVEAGLQVWQILPLGPPAYRGSPYNCLSAFAGNPLLIAPEPLRDLGLLQDEDLHDPPTNNEDEADLGAAATWKEERLRRAWLRFRDGKAGGEELERELASFCEAPEHSAWLQDWALYSALKQRHGGREWLRWERAAADRESAYLQQAEQELATELDYHRFVQFLFFRQWRQLRQAAHERGVLILGDLPIYVAHDSAEVWARRDLFDLDAQGNPLAVAGVPPDYFSSTGQRWGNPLYRWEHMAEDGYSWWIERIRANLYLADWVRLDHFRAFDAYWRVPAEEATAQNGTWEPGPGPALFRALEEALGSLPLVAEDLGEITPDVDALRDELHLPGMRILQFGMEDPHSLHAPHQVVEHCLYYTGTHDNDTLVGWFNSLDREVQQTVRDYCGASTGTVHWPLVRTVLATPAKLAVFPAQDLLGLDSRARMNVPAQEEGNWTWRLREGELTGEHAQRLRRLVELFGRLPQPGRGVLEV